MAYSAAVEQWRPLVAKYFPENLVDKALFVINGESGGNAGAVGDGGAARGLFQIQDSRNFASRPNAAYLDNPENNIKYAAQVLGAAQGKWTDWGEGSSYNGQPFGALGNNPYPGDSGPLGGRASTGAGITGSGGNTYGIYDNLSNNSSSWGFGDIGSIIRNALGGSGTGGTGRSVGGTWGTPGDANPGLSGRAPGATAGESTIDRIMREYGLTRDQALQMIGIDGTGASGTDHFGQEPYGNERDFGESVFRDRRDFGYNAQQDILDRELIDAENAAKAAQQKFDNAMAVGDFQAAQQAAADKNHWEQVAATQAQDRNNLTNQGQQLDYNLGLGNIAADRYGTDAQIGIANMQNQTEAALGQQRNQTGQFDAETARLNSERDYILGMANATTDAERVALDDKRRQDEVAIANMTQNVNFTLGQQNNQLGAYNADTDRMRSMQNYYASMANATNDAARVGIEDNTRLDRNSQFNAEQTNQFTLGQQGNQTNQFGAETDRANRMGTLALENNKFIADMSSNPRDMFALYAMQRGVAPDWGTIMSGGTPATGSALAPASVMNAYTPTTNAPTFNATAAQSTAQQNHGGSYGAQNNQFLQNWQGANTATSALPQFNAQFQGAQAQSSSGYDSSKNPFIGQQASYQPSTSAPSFNYTPQNAQTPTWTGPAAQSGFLPMNNNPVSKPTQRLVDNNPGGLQGGVPLAGMRDGLNMSTVGGGDITGADFTLPSYYDEGMSQPINPGDVVKGGSQVYSWYGPVNKGPHPIDPNEVYNGRPAGPVPVPQLNAGGMTSAPQFVSGDDPNAPDGLGLNAELNEPQVAPNGQYLGTKVTPLNPARRPMGNAWGNDTLRMAAGFGIRPSTMFSKR